MDASTLVFFVRSVGYFEVQNIVVIAKRGLYRYLSTIPLSFSLMPEKTEINAAQTERFPKEFADRGAKPAWIDIDIHRLDLRFEQTRISRPKPLARLIQSIAQNGLYLPIQVADIGDAQVVIDGYQRIDAYRTLNRDRIPAYCHVQSLEDALCEWFANQHSRALDPIEEAWLIQQLMDEGHTRQTIARQVGRGASWISRRIALLDGLSTPYQQALREGVLSSWAASRIFIPLARANKGDASQLLTALYQSPFSTRELSLWYQHYQKSQGEPRNRLLAHPRLFLDALNHKTEQKAQEQTGELGLLPKWLNELASVVHSLCRLEKRLPNLLQSAPDLARYNQMASQAAQAKQHIEQMAKKIDQLI